MERRTFHESWHRVAPLATRLRRSVRVIRQSFRGERWHVLEDPASGRFFRMNEPAYDFVARLDSGDPVETAWRRNNDRFGDAGLTQGEAIGLLAQLWQANLLHADAVPDTRAMLERSRERRARELRGFLGSLLFLRIPLVDPDRWLDRWAPMLGWLLGPIGAAAWLLLAAIGLWHALGHPADLAGDTANILQGRNLLPLYLTYAAIKTLHEMGHAVACKVLGRRAGARGEVHAIGLMLFIFLPIPYVDASSSWALRRRSHRIVIASAGILVELACAALAAVVWARTAEGTLAHAVAFNAMFLASVSTVLFNGNPLLRYDGYYILSDLIGVPNLAQRSREYLAWLVRAKAWRVRGVRNPAASPSEAAWLFSYGVLSAAYRLVVFAGLALFIASQQFLLGGAMLAFGLVAWILVPMGRLLHFLAASPELERTRRRAVLSTLAAAAVVLVPALLVPAPARVRAEAIAEPREFEVIRARVDGFVESAAPTGSAVGPGDHAAPLVILRNDDLVHRRDALSADLDRLRAARALAFRDDPARALQIDRQIEATNDQANALDADLASLRPCAAIPGTWIAPRIDRLPGTHLARGTTIGIVADPSGMRLRAVLDQRAAAAVIAEAGATVEVRALGRPEPCLRATLARVLPAGQRRLPSAALGLAAGGTTPTRPDDQEHRATTQDVFEAWIDLPPGHGLRPGQRAVVRFTLRPAPPLVQAARALRQTLQDKFNI